MIPMHTFTLLQLPDVVFILVCYGFDILIIVLMNLKIVAYNISVLTIIGSELDLSKPSCIC